jgi:endo-1,4-beta-xylanase
VDGIGLQFHFFDEDLLKRVVARTDMTPNQLYSTLDLYGNFKVPIHISETTIPSLPNNGEGQRMQAVMTRNFYRLWFSHRQLKLLSGGTPRMARPTKEKRSGMWAY